jgi:hypothetical protein
MITAKITSRKLEIKIKLKNKVFTTDSFSKIDISMAGKLYSPPLFIKIVPQN